MRCTEVQFPHSDEWGAGAGGRGQGGPWSGGGPGGARMPARAPLQQY